MFVYCIYLGENYVYYGSTTHLRKRQHNHNQRLRNPKYKMRLYEKARELGIEQLDLIQLHEGDDAEDVENELILNGDEYCLNMQSVKKNRQRQLRLHREAQARYIKRLNEKIKSN